MAKKKMLFFLVKMYNLTKLSNVSFPSYLMFTLCNVNNFIVYNIDKNSVDENN